MSFNLYLKATKSHKNFSSEKEVCLFQTPTQTTMAILSLPTFEEQLNSYCKWVDEIYPMDEDDVVPQSTIVCNKIKKLIEEGYQMEFYYV